MSLTNFTSTNAISSSELGPIAVSSTTGFPAVGTFGSRQLLQLDGEFMLVNYVPVSGSVAILQRGYNGTVAAAHEALAAGTTSATASDFLDVPAGAVSSRPPYVDDVQTIGVDTTFTAAGTAPTSSTLPIPTKNTTYTINKASAAAITLISATAASVGLRLTFVNLIAAANTITYTPGFLGDTTSSDVATSAAKVGAIFQIQCGPTGLWAAVNAGTGTSYTIG